MRRVLTVLVAGLVLLVAAHGLLWRWSEMQLAAGFEQWAAQRRAEGWTVRSGAAASGGWPLAATLSVPELTLSGGQPDLPRGLTWSAGRVVLRVALLRPHRLGIGLEGLGTLRLGDGPDIPFIADQLTATVPLDPGAPPRGADIAGKALRIGLLQGGLAAHPLTVGLLQVHLDTTPAAVQGEPAIAVSASAQDIALPPPPAGRIWPLGAGIASISVEGALTGPLPRRPDPVARATGWRDGGGTLEIRRLAIGWGPLGLAGSATIALDDRLQPMGAASAHLVGQAETLDALAAAGTIGASTAMAARAVLGLMARAPEGGGTPQVDVPLTLQNRTLAMGRIPLAKLPELVWPQPAPAL